MSNSYMNTNASRTMNKFKNTLKQLARCLALLTGLAVATGASAQLYDPNTPYQEAWLAGDPASYSLGQGSQSSYLLQANAKATLTYAPGYEQSRKLRNMISLNVWEENLVYVMPDFTAKVSVSIKYGQSATNTVSTPITKDLEVNYKKGAGQSYDAINYISFENAPYVEVTVVSIDAPMVGNFDPKKVLILKNQIYYTSYYEMAASIPQPVLQGTVPTGHPDVLNVHWEWSLTAGNNYTQLEWTWLETEDKGRYLVSGVVDKDALFRNNATSLDLAANPGNFEIPLLYDGVGELYYRVRPVTIRQDGSREEGNWYYPDQPYGFTGHEPSLNWQATTTFAEDGKDMSIIQYYDGSLRGRQTVTKDNSTHTTISTEMLYDWQGRPAVHVLPAPGMNQIIAYTKGLNLFNGADGVNAQGMDENPARFFDMQPLVVPNPLNAVSGASNYYSPANPLASQGMNKNIPDAQGYPYSLTRYTPDGTGRVLSQSGVGEALKMGGGHETKYYYSSASQDELDALFGTEVGEYSHYSKNMVKDANGQMSVSYLDMAGRTIATALAGDAPANLTELTSAGYQSAKSNPISRQLLSSSTNVRQDNTYEMVTSLPVPATTLYSFDYNLTPGKLTVGSCKSNQPICYDCLYDLEITVTDDADEQAAHSFKFTNLHATPAVTCTEGAPGFTMVSNTDPVNGTDFSLTLAPGTYTIRKTLKVSQPSLDYYLAQYRNSLDSCFNRQSIIDSVELVLKNRTHCDNPVVETCEACRTSVGSSAQFILNYLSGAGITTPTQQQLDEATAAYYAALANCSSLCNDAPQTLEAIHRAMLDDMMPYTGQYARENAPATGQPHAAYDKYDIFSNAFPSNQQPFYRWPLNPSGLDLLTRNYYYNDLAQVDPRMHGTPPSYDRLNGISKADFEQDFDRAWAESLLPHHPEFQKYKFAVDHLSSAYTWIDQFMQPDNFSTSAAGGLLTNDPFFNSNLTAASQMATYMNSSLTGQASMGALPYSMWQVAYGDVRCKGRPDPVDRANCYQNAPHTYTDAAFTALTTDEKNQAWTVFKSFYSAVRSDAINAYIKANTDPIFASDLVNEQYVLHFPDDNRSLAQQLNNQDPGNWGWYPPANGGQPTLPTTPGNSIYTSPCSNYILVWKLALQKCAYLANNSAIVNEIVNGLLTVCQNGSDAAHPRGSASVAPQYAGSPRSFEEVVHNVFAAHNISLTNLCQPFVIEFPKLYDKAPVYDHDVASQIDTCNCTQYAKIVVEAQSHNVNVGNLTSLNQYLVSNYGDSLTLRVYNALQHCSQLHVFTCSPVVHEIFYNCSDSVPCVEPAPRVGHTTPDSLARCSVYCSTDSCYFTDAFYVLPQPQPMPEFLKCGFAGNASCISCTQLKDLIASYKTYFAGTTHNTAPTLNTDDLSPAEIDNNVLLAQYLNYYTGFQYTWMDYLRAAADKHCPLALDSAGNSLAVICPSPEPLNDPSPFVHTEDPCARVHNLAIAIGQDIYQHRIDALLEEFRKKYLDKCLGSIGEEFTVNYTNKEYHYTLYYYDQSGNLVKTVPPKGVAADYSPGFLSTVRDWRNDPAKHKTPNHTFTTQYRYNSLNEVVEQVSPDGGISRFWYDRLGHLVVSQNAQQAEDGKYSYTLYDELERMIEVGQKVTNAGMDQTISENDQALANWIQSSGAREQVTNTFYDLAYGPGLAPRMTQENLRNRVSYACTRDHATADPTEFVTASFYNYDVHGNVSSLLQDYKGLPDMATTDNRFKFMSYDYDLITGKVNYASYQPGKGDAFYHHYDYDAQNRLTEVYTSRDQLLWEKDATYSYYKNGPLARMELGKLKVQGVDYAYTAQGWLKGVNSTSLLPDKDMGGDGSSLTATARDIFGFSLHYYDDSRQDYLSIGTLAGGSAFARPDAGANLLSLYNGNIAGMAVNNGGLRRGPVNTTNAVALFNRYQYDQLNRLIGMQVYQGLNETTNTWSGLASAGAYNESVAYDPNGNILTYQRQGWKSGSSESNPAPQMDQLTYTYKSGENQLMHIADAIGSGDYSEDLDDQGANHNYTYDKIGNILSDGNSMQNVNWTIYGKLNGVTIAGTRVSYVYNSGGDRIAKLTPAVGTYYVRDARGNIVSIYEKNTNGNIVQSEAALYGLLRLGENTQLAPLTNLNDVVDGYGPSRTNVFTRGRKSYELSNQLGNVLTVVSDKKLLIIPGLNDQNVDGNGCAIGSGFDVLTENQRGAEAVYVARQEIDFEDGFESGYNDEFDAYIDNSLSACLPLPPPIQMPIDAYFAADVKMATDYYPFGMTMQGRNVSSYRFGFNGKELDPETTNQDYGMRIYDSRLGRFLSVDPISAKFPMLSPYQFASDRPIEGIDLDGLEFLPFHVSMYRMQNLSTTNQQNVTTNNTILDVVYENIPDDLKDPAHHTFKYVRGGPVTTKGRDYDYKLDGPWILPVGVYYNGGQSPAFIGQAADAVPLPSDATKPVGVKFDDDPSNGNSSGAKISAGANVLAEGGGILANQLHVSDWNDSWAEQIMRSAFYAVTNLVDSYLKINTKTGKNYFSDDIKTPADRAMLINFVVDGYLPTEETDKFIGDEYKTIRMNAYRKQLLTAWHGLQLLKTNGNAISPETRSMVNNILKKYKADGGGDEMDNIGTFMPNK